MGNIGGQVHRKMWHTLFKCVKVFKCTRMCATRMKFARLTLGGAFQMDGTLGSNANRIGSDEIICTSKGRPYKPSGMKGSKK